MLKISKKMKVLSAAAALFVFGSAGAFGIGLGAQFGGGYVGAATGNLAFLFSPSKTKHLAVGLGISGNTFVVDAAFDWWAYNPTLTTFNTSSGNCPLKFFVGPGVGLKFGGFSDLFFLGAGLRVPVGLDFIISKFDIFLEVVPYLGFEFLPTLSFPDWGLANVSLGARYWF